MLDAPKARLNSPVTVNVAPDGSAYLVSKRYDAPFIPETNQTGRGREKRAFWPLTADGIGLGPLRLVRNCLAEFGEPPASADHGAAPEKVDGGSCQRHDGTGKWRVRASLTSVSCLPQPAVHPLGNEAFIAQRLPYREGRQPLPRPTGVAVRMVRAGHAFRHDRRTGAWICEDGKHMQVRIRERKLEDE